MCTLTYQLNKQGQAVQQRSHKKFESRGQIILKLLADAADPIKALQEMSLSEYLAFQICIFPADLCIDNADVVCFVWDG